MYTYNVDGKNYTYTKEIGQEEAERRVRAFQEKQANAQKGNQGTYEGFFTEAGEGVISGLTKIPEGIISLGTLAYDAVTGENQTDKFEAFMDKIREDMGIDPEGAAGKVTEALVQFGIPGIGAASVAAKAGRVGRILAGRVKVGARNPQINPKDVREIKTKLGETSRGRDVFYKFRDKKTGEIVTRKQTKAQKLGRGALIVSSAGLADAIVSTDDTQTIGDFFEEGPTQTIDAVGMEGQERTFAKLMNKLKVGVEGGIATAILPAALGSSLNVLSKTLGARPVEGLTAINETLGNFVGKALPKETTVLDLASGFTVPLMRDGVIPTIKSGISKREAELLAGQDASTLRSFIGKMEALLRYRGFLDPIVARSRSLINPQVEGNIKIAKDKMKVIDKKINETLKKQRYLDLPDVSKKKYIDNFMDVLEGARKGTDLRDAREGLSPAQTRRVEAKSQRIIDLPDELYKLYLDAANTIRGLTDDFLKSKVIDDLPEGAAIQGGLTRDAFKAQVERMMREGGYLRRLYRAYNDKNYKLKPEARNEIVNKIIAREGIDYGHIKGILEDTPFRLNNQNMQELVAGTTNLSRQQAEAYIDKVIDNAKKKGGNTSAVSRIFQTRLDTSLINKRKVDSDVLRAILGEIRDPREAFISTVSELSNFIATDKFLNTFKNIADANIAQVAARNASRPVSLSTKVEEPLYYKMDDEIIKHIEKNAEKFNLTQDQVEALGRAQDLNENLFKKALEDWLDKHPNHVILGRSDETSIRADRYVPGANATSSIYGNMFGYAVPRVMFNNLSASRYFDADTMPTLMRNTYGFMLDLKGRTQYAKTILSPLTQVRNITSAAGFALAQGNVGKGSSLGTSVNVVLRDVIDKELKIKNKTFLDLDRDNETLEFLVDMQKRGVIGSSAQLREIQDNLRKGLGYESKGDYVEGQLTGKNIDRRNPDFRQTRRSKLGQFFAGPLNLAEDLYRGGDDVWKIYNYLFELQKYKNIRTKMHNSATSKLKKTDAFRNLNADQQKAAIQAEIKTADANFARDLGLDPNVSTIDLMEGLKRYTADNIRNLVPNYELVPDAIKGLRGTPFGNFVAFPAEIIRTGFNTLDVAMKELGSNNAAVREVGARRLTSAMFTFGVLGEGLQRFGQMMTGTSDEEVDSINRLSAPWQRNALLIPVGKDEKGNPEVVDFSHTNPWDMLSKPFHTLARSLREGTRLDKSDVEKVSKAAYDSLAEFFTPFTEVSMIYDSLVDVLPRESVLGLGIGRGGRTRSGAKIYKEGDGLGLSLEKSLVHVLDTLKPNIIPVRVPTGADLGITRGQAVKSPELGRTARGVFFPEGGEFAGFNVTAEEPTTGRKYTRTGELFRAFTGLQTQIIDRDKIAEFKAQEFKGQRSDAATLFTDVLRLQDPSEDQILEAYLRADDARFKAFKQMKLNYDDLKRLGFSDRKLIKILKEKANLGNVELGSLKKDKYVPYVPDAKKLGAAKKRGIKIPMSALRKLIRNRLNIRMTPVPKEEEPVELDVNNLLDLNKTNIPVDNVNPQPENLTQPEVNVTQNNRVTNELLRVAPENREVAAFLGSNPEDILKNMQIARRTG